MIQVWAEMMVPCRRLPSFISWTRKADEAAVQPAETMLKNAQTELDKVSQMRSE